MEEIDPSLDPKWEKKHITFINWKHAKAEQALTQVDAIKDDIIDNLIFETIIDYCRQKFGSPDPPTIRELTNTSPSVPSLPLPIRFEVPEIRRTQTCPICKESHDASRFTAHLSTCILRVQNEEVKHQILVDITQNHQK